MMQSKDQSYAVTKDSLQQVRNQAGGIANNSGISTRQNAEEKITQGRQEIASTSLDTTSQGITFKNELQVEQGKGVVRRVGTKGIQEIKNLANDAVELSKSTWDKIGESQQK